MLAGKKSYLQFFIATSLSTKISSEPRVYAPPTFLKPKVMYVRRFKFKRHPLGPLGWSSTAQEAQRDMETKW